MLLVLLDPAAATNSLVRFDVAHDAGGYRVDASADLDADAALVWETLTDYEKLPQFVPGVSHVRVLESRTLDGRERLLVEQAGEVRFLFFSRRVDVLLEVEHQPRTRIVAHAVPRPRIHDSGTATLDWFRGVYTVDAVAGGSRLGYRAQFTLGFSLPPLIGPFAVRRTMQARFEAMLAEIERRRLARAKP